MTISFVQNQDYSGFLIHHEKIIDGVISNLDISGISESTLRCYRGDTLLFSGSKTGGEIAFLTNGTDGKLVYDTQAGDMSSPGNYHVEVETILDSEKIKERYSYIEITAQAPTS